MIPSLFLHLPNAPCHVDSRAENPDVTVEASLEIYDGDQSFTEKDAFITINAPKSEIGAGDRDSWKKEHGGGPFVSPLPDASFEDSDLGQGVVQIKLQEDKMADERAKLHKLREFTVDRLLEEEASNVVSAQAHNESRMERKPSKHYMDFIETILWPEERDFESNLRRLQEVKMAEDKRGKLVSKVASYVVPPQAHDTPWIERKTPSKNDSISQDPTSQVVAPMKKEPLLGLEYVFCLSNQVSCAKLSARMQRPGKISRISSYTYLDAACISNR